MSTGRRPRVGELVRVTCYMRDPVNWLVRVTEEYVTSMTFRSTKFFGGVLGDTRVILVYGDVYYDDFHVLAAKDLTDEEITAVARHALIGDRDAKLET